MLHRPDQVALLNTVRTVYRAVAWKSSRERFQNLEVIERSLTRAPPLRLTAVTTHDLREVRLRTDLVHTQIADEAHRLVDAVGCQAVKTHNHGEHLTTVVARKLRRTAVRRLTVNR